MTVTLLDYCSGWIAVGSKSRRKGDKEEKSVSRWMDKKAVVHIHNWILLSYEKECIWISSNEVDETRAYYIEWNKSERETPIQDINAYI